MTGFAVEGASYSEEKLKPLSEHESLHQALQPLCCRWVRKGSGGDRIQIPVYLNSTRKNIVMSVLLSKSCNSI